MKLVARAGVVSIPSHRRHTSSLNACDNEHQRIRVHRNIEPVDHVRKLPILGHQVHAVLHRRNGRPVTVQGSVTSSVVTEHLRWSHSIRTRPLLTILPSRVSPLLCASQTATTLLSFQSTCSRSTSLSLLLVFMEMSVPLGADFSKPYNVPSSDDGSFAAFGYIGAALVSDAQSTPIGVLPAVSVGMLPSTRSVASMTATTLVRCAGHANGACRAYTSGRACGGTRSLRRTLQESRTGSG